MRKLVKSAFVITLLVLLAANINSTSASASKYKPTDTWNLSTQGVYKNHGNAASVDLYSNYFYTGANRLLVAVDNKGTKDLTVEIYRSDSIICYYRYVVPAGEGHIFSMNCTKSKKYYFKFKRPCYFQWWVKAG